MAKERLKLQEWNEIYGPGGASMSTAAIQVAERPILFSGALVRAILEERKTQTRRVAKALLPGDKNYIHAADSAEWRAKRVEQCPYGKPGDRLWVRETFAAYGMEALPDKARPLFYRADDDKQEGWATPPDIHWTPSIHMPRWASRLTLEIVKVRVERVQEISEEDVQREGVDERLFRELLRPADRFNVVPEHWIHGSDDESCSFCEPCCRKEIERLTKLNPECELILDGGWDTEGDSQPFCETCGRALSNTFTDYCAEEELSYFEENGFDVSSPSDCYGAQRIIGSQLWEGGALSTQIHKLAFRALWDSINSKRGFGWDKNPFVWVIEFKRVRP